ncbi:MAG: hypothetical protein IPN93_04370 [Bacteroidetes bacterium]|nr:hypothetical protein [Bacteroidota bacterium]
MKTIIFILTFTIYNSIDLLSQDVYIDSSNYKEFLDLENLSINKDLETKLELLIDSKLVSFERNNKKLIQEEFKIKKSWISSIEYFHNYYSKNKTMLSLGFIRFTINEKKKTRSLIKIEKNKPYGNFKCLVLTKYFLTQNNNEFLIIFSETPQNKLIEKLFYH